MSDDIFWVGKMGFCGAGGSDVFSELLSVQDYIGGVFFGAEDGTYPDFVGVGEATAEFFLEHIGGCCVRTRFEANSKMFIGPAFSNGTDGFV